MEWNLNTCLSLFQGEKTMFLRRGLHGLEKESLRTDVDGNLALSQHPTALGDPLTHPNLTTDFSESQLEFITDPHPTIEDARFQLEELHQFVWDNLDEEYIWPLSMPSRLPEESQIPIARFSESEEGRRRELYREGLAHRYGKTMQTLCGVHYNFSFDPKLWEHLHTHFAPEENLQDFINERSLALVRNFARYRWLLVALFGASPLCDESYKCKAAQHNKGKATSLRMSKCGYTNPAKIDINYNDFSAHLKSIETAMNTHHPEYEGAGLNANLLQIPNEYYFSIRLKAKSTSSDNLIGLKETGVEYIEVRLFDLNPYEFTGVSAHQLQFTHLFLLTCLFSESPELDQKALQEATKNQETVAIEGRNPALILKRNGEDITMQDWIAESIKLMTPLASLMGEQYEKLIANYSDTEYLSSAIQSDMEEHEESHIEFGLRMAKEHQANS